MSSTASPIHVDSSGRFLRTRDGRPFFWLADTAWDLFHRLTDDEADDYFADRAAKGFNIVQAVVISEFFGLRPSISGIPPFVDGDVTRPDERFFAHVRRLIQLARKHGLLVLVLPTWAEYVTQRVTDTPYFTTEALGYGYGRFLGAFLGDLPNVLWCLGGDRLPDEQPWGCAVWRAMAHGIADGVNGFESPAGETDFSRTFMTFHCYRTSSTWFHGDAWLDMNLWGSYHSDRYAPECHVVAHHDTALVPPKPTLNGEAAYENFTIDYVEGTGRFDARDERRHAWWSVFAGTCGHTYGAGEIYPFFNPEGPFGKVNFSEHCWREAMAYPGSSQMRVLKDLVEPLLEDRTSVPDLVVDNPPRGPFHTESMVCDGGRRAYVFTPARVPLRIDATRLAPTVRLAAWLDPATGATTPARPWNGTDALLPPLPEDAVLLLS